MQYELEQNVFYLNLIFFNRMYTMNHVFTVCHLNVLHYTCEEQKKLHVFSFSQVLQIATIILYQNAYCGGRGVVLGCFIAKQVS
jgi:hypothetical protein